MELSRIVEMLSEYRPQIVASTQDPVYIQTHKMIKPGQNRFYQQCLYVGHVSDLGAYIDDNEISNLICIEDRPLPTKYAKSENLNMILIAGSINQFDVLNELADIMIDEAKLIAHMRRLLDALYANRGLQYMVDVASEVFGNPIFVNDIAYRILSVSKAAYFEDHTLEMEKELGYIHEENIISMRKDHLFERIQDMDKPLYSKKFASQVGFLFRTIKIHEIDVGMVALVENNREFSAIDYELLDRFSKLIAIEMEKSDFYKDNKGVMYSYFLADLLTDRLKSKKIIEQRLALLHWKLYGYYQMFVVSNIDDNDSIHKFQSLGQGFRQIIPVCRWTVYEHKLVVFYSRADPNLLSLSEKAMLKDFLRTNHLSIGVCSPYSDILLTQKYYQQALHAAELGAFLGNYQEFYLYSELIVPHIAQVISEKYSLHDFSHPAIDILKHYDDENNASMIETLRQHLFHFNDPVGASNALHIHRNTLLYRINKIKEITGLSLSNGDEILLLQLSLKFSEYSLKTRLSFP